MLHSKRLQRCVELGWPMNQLMHHHGSCPSRCRLESSFCDFVLMVSANTTVGNSLLLKNEIVKKFRSFKRVVISSVRFDLESIELGLMFKGMLADERLAYSH